MERGLPRCGVSQEFWSPLCVAVLVALMVWLPAMSARAEAPAKSPTALQLTPTLLSAPAPTAPEAFTPSLRVTSAPFAPALVPPSLSLARRSATLQWTGEDWALAALVGAGGTVLGGLGGGFLSAAFCDGGFECLGVALLGVLVGGTVVGSSAVWTYGELSGFDGAYWATFLGGVAATAIMIGGLAALDGGGDAVNVAIGVTALVGLPLASTAGYFLTMSPGHQGQAAGLFNVAPDGGVAVGMPAVQLGVEEEGFRVGVPLLSGSF